MELNKKNGLPSNTKSYETFSLAKEFKIRSKKLYSQFCKDGVKDIFLKDLPRYDKKSFMKNEIQSYGFRLLGNKKYVEEDYLGALQMYNKALIYAPFAEQSLGFGFANRSIVLLQLKRYEECLENINWAIKFGYPKEQLSKLLSRKQKCLNAVNKDNKQQQQQRSNKKSFTLSRQNDKLSSAVDSLEVFENPEKGGRGLRARRFIRKGELIIYESPVAAILSPDHYESYCYNCLRKVNDYRVFPCRGCTQIRFCGDSCESIAWDNFHQHECKYLDFLPLPKGFNYAPRLALRVLLSMKPENVVKTIRNAISGRIDVDYTKTDYSRILTLMDHADHCSDYSSAALLVLAFLTCLYPDIPKEDESTLAGAILMHIQQTQANGLSITSREQLEKGTIETEIDTFDDKDIGCGLYLTFSLVNHSCAPNALVYVFDGKEMGMVAIRDIQPGEEVYHSYGTSEFWQPTYARKQMLEKSYFFDCKCTACEGNNEPTMNAMRCSSCEGPVLSLGQWICLDCGQRNAENFDDYTNETNMCWKAVQMADKALGEKQITLREYEEKLRQCLLVMSNRMYRDNKRLGQIKEKLSSCCRSLGDLELATKYAQESLEIIKAEYWDTHIQVFNRLLKLIVVQSELVKGQKPEDCKLKEVLRDNKIAAITIMNKLFAPTSEYRMNLINLIKN